MILSLSSSWIYLRIWYWNSYTVWYKRTLHCTNSILLKLRNREAPTLPEIKDSLISKVSSHGNITKGFVVKVLQRYTACMCQHWDSNIKVGSITRRNLVTGMEDTQHISNNTNWTWVLPLSRLLSFDRAKCKSHIQFTWQFTDLICLSVCLSAQLSHRSEAGHTTPQTWRHKISVLLLGENLQQPNGRFKAVNNYIIMSVPNSSFWDADLIFILCKVVSGENKWGECWKSEDECSLVVI